MQSVINQVTSHDTHEINGFDQEDVPELKGRVRYALHFKKTARPK